MRNSAETSRQGCAVRRRGRSLVSLLLISAVATSLSPVDTARAAGADTLVAQLSTQLLRQQPAGGDLVVVTEVAGVPTFTVIEDVDTVTEAATVIETAVRAKGRRAVLTDADWQETATLTGVTGPLPQWPVTALGLGTAWAASTGTGVTVAVVDSGVVAHPDIPNLLPGFSSVGGTVTTGQTDTYGHGTHVAGIIAAGSDGIGTTGVAYNAKILPIRAFTGTSAPASDVAAGIVKAVQEGAQVINMGFGFSSENAALTAAIDYAVANNVVLVAATGNEAQGVKWPAADPRVIAVGATKEDGNLWLFSNTGSQIDVVAPGRNVYSTVVATPYFPGIGGITDGSSSYAIASGTSMASSHVAGVAALLLARHPEATRDQVAMILTSSATDKGTAGFDTSYGWGLVNPVGALAASDTVLGTPAGAPGAVSDLTATSGDGEIRLTWTAAPDNGAAVTDYRIEYSANAGTSWVTFNDGVNTNTSVTITGLVNGTNYTFRVSALNTVGWGSAVTATGTPVKELTTQVVTFAEIATTKHPATFTVSPTTTSGLDVAVVSLTNDVCVVEGAVVRTLRTGACTLRATQDGNADYRPAEPVERSFSVTGVAIDILSPDLSRPLSGNTVLSLRVTDLADKAWLRLTTGENKTLATTYLAPGGSQPVTMQFRSQSVIGGSLTLVVETTSGQELYRVQQALTTDHIAPTLSVGWPAGERVRGETAMPLNVGDDRGVDHVTVFAGSVELARQEGASTAITLNTAVLSDGLQEFNITATDIAGNSRTVRRSFWVDNAAPTLRWTPTTKPGATKTTFRFTASDNEKVRLVELLDGETVVTSVAGTASAITWLRTYPTEPSALRLRATDTAGNQTTTAVFPVPGEQRIQQPVVQVTQNTTNSALLLWGAPASYDGPLTRYQLLSQGTAANLGLINAEEVDVSAEHPYLLDATLRSSAGRYALTDLDADHRYVLYLRACTSVTCSPATKIVVDTAPKAAENLSYTDNHDGSMRLTWANGVGSAQTVFYRRNTESTWTEWTPGSVDVSPTTITGLQHGVVYTVKVATTGRLATVDSRWLAGIQVWRLPTTPLLEIGEVGTNSVALTWSTGGAPDYADFHNVYVNGDKAATARGTQTTVYKLTSNTRYMIEVESCNSVGCSARALSEVRTTTVPPAAPRWVRATPTLLGLRTEWSPSYATGGAPATTYRASAQPGGAFCETAGLSCEIEGLDPGIEYQVTVQAANAAGYSGASIVTTESRATPLALLEVAYDTSADGTVRPVVIGGDGTNKYSVSGTLPAGVRFSPSTGQFSGSVKLKEGVVDVAVGGSFVCVLTTLGGVRCMGENYEGVLGNGQLWGGASKGEDYVIDLSRGVTALEAGYSHVCALLEDGTVRCWGANGDLQLGSGTLVTVTCEDCENGIYQYYESESSPIEVPGITGRVTKLATGNGSNTCVLLDNGRAGCWGNGHGFQLIPESRTHGEILDVSVRYDICILYVDGYVACSRSVQNFSAEDHEYYWYHQGYQFPAGTIEIALGDATLCGRTAEGNVYCTGNNYKGQLGLGYFSPPNSGSTGAVYEVPTNLIASSLMSYWDSTCILTTSSTLYCWGGGNSGQLGIGSDEDRSSPTQVPDLLDGVRAVDLGPWGGCAVTQKMTLRCWGSTALWVANTPNGYYRDPVLKTGIDEVASLGDNSCAVTIDERLLCWGYNANWLLQPNGRRSGPDSIPVPGMQSNVKQTSGSCVLLTDGSVWCRGQYAYESAEFIPIDSLPVGALSVSSNYAFSCALLENGSVWCWQFNGYEEGTPVWGSAWQVENLPDRVSELIGGAEHFCALTVDGDVRCWGYNYYGQLGTGVRNLDSSDWDRRVALEPVGLPGAVSLDAVGYSTCILSVDGDAWCWGAVTQGANWWETGTDDMALPAKVNEIGHNLSVVYTLAYSGGGEWDTDTVCGANSAGELLCWSGNWAQWADTPVKAQTFPVEAGAIKEVAGDCLLTRDGKIYCWGYNGDGRIADQNWYRPLPVDVGNSEEGGYPVTVTVRSGTQTRTVTLLLGA